MYLPQFQSIGRALAESGLITGASGNLSIRVEDRLIITQHGSLLSDLSPADLIETGIYADDAATPLASWELPVHRAIYIATPACAIVHAHPPGAVTLSLAHKDVSMPGGFAVIGASAGIVAGVLADEIACELKSHPLVMVKGHGSFASGTTLEDAGLLTVTFEKECALLCRRKAIPIVKAGE